MPYSLQALSDETPTFSTTITEDGACLDVSADGFWPAAGWLTPESFFWCKSIYSDCSIIYHFYAIILLAVLEGEV